MNKKHIIIAALAFGAIGLMTATTPLQAAPANVFQNIEIQSENAVVIKIGKRKRSRKRHGFYNSGVSTSVATTCNYYYHKAVSTGLRYWWVKYRHTCLQ